MSDRWAWKILDVMLLDDELFVKVRRLRTDEPKVARGQRLKAELGTKGEVLAPLELCNGTKSIKSGPPLDTAKFQVVIENQYRHLLTEGLLLKPLLDSGTRTYPRPHVHAFRLSDMLDSMAIRTRAMFDKVKE